MKLLARIFIVVLFWGIIKIAWDPNSETDLAGYKVYYGTSSRTYDMVVNVGNVTTWTVSPLEAGRTYYIAVTAYDRDSNESGFSNEVSGDATAVQMKSLRKKPPQ